MEATEPSIGSFHKHSVTIACIFIFAFSAQDDTEVDKTVNSKTKRALLAQKIKTSKFEQKNRLYLIEHGFANIEQAGDCFTNIGTCCSLPIEYFPGPVDNSSIMNTKHPNYKDKFPSSNFGFDNEIATEPSVGSLQY